MDAATILSLALSCAPQVHAETALALVTVESALNPWAIGVVDGQLLRQPRDPAEALATARALQALGWNFSLGLAQINVRNFPRLGLSLESAFDACTNLAAMQTVLGECFDRATVRTGKGTARRAAPAQAALRQALSCYYSGNFVTGFRHGYVRKVETTATARIPVPPPPP